MRALPVGVALGALALAVAALWWATGEAEPIPPPRPPGHRGSDFEAVVAAVQPIGPFEQFYINDDNPFVPWKERAVERQRLQPPPPAAVPPPRPPPRIVPIQPPKLELPRLPAPVSGDAPRVLGFTRYPDGTEALLVQPPEGGAPQLLVPGERSGRWTFIAIDGGAIAVFADEFGRQHRFPIGR